MSELVMNELVMSRHLNGQLKECPFCGTRDALGISWREPPIEVRCEICDIVFQYGYNSTTDETITAWNVRVDPSE